MAEKILPSLYVGLSAWIIQDGNLFCVSAQTARDAPADLYLLDRTNPAGNHPLDHRPDELSGETRKRDEQRESFQPVSKTSAWQDDGGNSHYILTCAWESH